MDKIGEKWKKGNENKNIENNRKERNTFIECGIIQYDQILGIQG